MQVVINTQKAVYNALSADSALMEMVKNIYDYAPKTAVLPYITIGEVGAVNRSGLGRQAYELELAVRVYDASTGRKNALQIASRVHELLDSAPLIIEDYVHYETKFSSQQTDLIDEGSKYSVEANYIITVAG